MMIIAPLLFAAQAAAQPAAESHRRPLFISPMGEPFRNRTGDALADWFNQADRNHDGRLTLEEMQQDAERFFAALDVNHDGEIDPDEITRYETQIAPRNRASLGLLNISEPVTTADANFNRGISLQEFRTAAEKRFAALDLDHRGSLSLDALERIRPAPATRQKRDYDNPSNQLDANADTGG